VGIRELTRGNRDLEPFGLSVIGFSAKEIVDPVEGNFAGLDRLCENKALSFDVSLDAPGQYKEQYYR